MIPALLGGRRDLVQPNMTPCCPTALYTSDHSSTGRLTLSATSMPSFDRGLPTLHHASDDRKPTPGPLAALSPHDPNSSTLRTAQVLSPDCLPERKPVWNEPNSSSLACCNHLYPRAFSIAGSPAIGLRCFIKLGRALLGIRVASTSLASTSPRVASTSPRTASTRLVWPLLS